MTVLRLRLLLATAGLLLMALGILRLLTQVPFASLVWLGVWLVVAVVVHDGVLAPATVGVGLLLRGIPARARRYVQGGLVAAALITAVSVPLLIRHDTQPQAKAILQRDYAAGLVVLLSLVVVVSAGSYVVRRLRDRRTARS